MFKWFVGKIYIKCGICITTVHKQDMQPIKYLSGRKRKIFAHLWYLMAKRGK